MTDRARTLTELLSAASARRFLEAPLTEDLGLAEGLPFPFLALVGQSEMKLALILSLINPNVDGVLLIGNRGTGKSTAVRGLINLLPEVDRSLCPYGCLPEDIETGGIDEVCPDCARKYGEGETLVYRDSVQLIELPLNAKLEDVIGGLDSRTGDRGRACADSRGARLHRGHRTRGRGTLSGGRPDLWAPYAPHGNEDRRETAPQNRGDHRGCDVPCH